MKDLFRHFKKSYLNALCEMFLCPAPFCLLIFGIPIVGPLLYFMTFYDPGQTQFDALNIFNKE